MDYQLTDDLFEAEVERGMRWLDTVAPGWENRIDRETLSLIDVTACICGQVFKEEGREHGTHGYGWAQQNGLFDQATAFLAGAGVIDPADPPDQTDEVRAYFGFNIHDSLYSQRHLFEESYDEEEVDGDVLFNHLQATWQRKLDERDAAKWEIKMAVQLLESEGYAIGAPVR